MAANRATPAQKAASSRLWIWVTLVLVGLLASNCLPVTALIAGGMLPTIVAYVIDRDPKKYSAFTVGLMNAAGVIPYVILLWKNGVTMDHSLHLMMKPMAWVVMYGSAAGGWLIYFSVPPVVHAFLQHRTKVHIAELRRRQAAIAELWGDGVINTPFKEKSAVPLPPRS